VSLVKNHRRFRQHFRPHHQGYITGLIKGTELVPETSVIWNELTGLIAREDFIKVLFIKQHLCPSGDVRRRATFRPEMCPDEAHVGMRLGVQNGNRVLTERIVSRSKPESASWWNARRLVVKHLSQYVSTSVCLSTFRTQASRRHNYGSALTCYSVRRFLHPYICDVHKYYRQNWAIFVKLGMKSMPLDDTWPVITWLETERMLPVL
jgi:hypothetical protein